MSTTPKYLYKIVSPEEWQKSTQEGYVIQSSLDHSFIHLAKDEQISHVVQKFWQDQAYVILTLETEQLEGDLRLETNPGGTTLYYHLYEGRIPLHAVVYAHVDINMT
jgi:uncharacterized protein (DUF952 family)